MPPGDRVTDNKFVAQLIAQHLKSERVRQAVRPMRT
jgi:hypothetical protein